MAKDRLFLVFVIFLLAVSLHTVSAFYSAEEWEEDKEEFEEMHVTCSSAIKIKHVASDYYLHSHNIKWGSGSHQQSVTAMKDPHETGNLWSVKEGESRKMCRMGQAIKCNDVIRLEHANTAKNLHSDEYNAPLSSRREISGFGNDGDGDSGDNWTILCTNKEVGELLQVKDTFYLFHTDSKRYLYANRDVDFNRRNCGNCPILGQLEVSGDQKQSNLAIWTIDGGVIFPETEDEEIPEDM